MQKIRESLIVKSRNSPENSLMVPEGGLEPPQTQGPADFESAASTIPPLRQRHLYNIPRVACPENERFGTMDTLSPYIENTIRSRRDEVDLDGRVARVKRVLCL